MKIKKLLCLGLSSAIVASMSISSFADDVTIINVGPIDTMIEELDPKTYGGIYMEGNELHIQAINQDAVTGTIARMRNKVDETVICDTNIVQYSMQDLSDAKELLLSMHDELGITGVGFNGQENALAVYLPKDKDNELSRQSILSISPIKNIIFRSDEILSLTNSDESSDNVAEDDNVIGQSDEQVTARLNLRGGQLISNTSAVSSYWSTIATSAVKGSGSNRKLGFITCGHGYTLNQSVYQYGTYLGKVAYVKNSGSIDIAFVESPYNTQGVMTNGDIIDSRSGPVTNMSVVLHGGKSGRISGKVLDTDISGYWGTTAPEDYFTGLFSMSCKPVNGDSGAAVIYNKHTIVGIAKGQYNGETQGAAVNMDTVENQTDILPSC